MKHYLAGLFSRKDELRGYADQIKTIGHEVTSSWLYNATDDAPIEDYRSPFAVDIAEKDLADVLRADSMILFTQERGPWSGGGRFIEFGVALARRKVLSIVGPIENIFLGHPTIGHYETVDELLSTLADWPDWTAYLDCAVTDQSDDAPKRRLGAPS